MGNREDQEDALTLAVASMLTPEQRAKLDRGETVKFSEAADWPPPPHYATRQAPPPRSLWVGKSGTYRVDRVSNQLATRPDWPITVDYTRLEDGSTWTCPLSKWPGSKVMLAKTSIQPDGLDVKFKILDPRIGTEWPLPNYATAMSAGMDLRACFEPKSFQTQTIEPGETMTISSGIAIHLDNPSYAAIVLPRSGLGSKGLVLGNLVGLIDADYQGPLLMCCWNRGQDPITIEAGDRIAQLVVLPIARVRFTQVAEFVASDRGTGGYGHTGIA